VTWVTDSYFKNPDFCTKYLCMKDFVKKYSVELIFALLGALSGFLYWKYIGCLSGTCAIKSVWYLSTLFGLFAGYLIGDLVKSIYLKTAKKGKNDEEL